MNDSFKGKGLGVMIVVAFLILTGVRFLSGGEENNSTNTASKPSKVNPVDGCLTYWTSERSRPGQPTRAYDGRRLNGERQYLVDHPTEGRIWVSHIRIEHDDCIWDLN
ncbi:hypothetical protein P4S64_01860 [Vibrio sp. M60_M31a]